MPDFAPAAEAAFVLAPVRAVIGGALVLATGRAAACAAFALPAARAAATAAAFALAAASEGAGTRFVMTPGRNAGAEFVFDKTRGAAALVPDCLPALFDDGPQPVMIMASSAAPISSRPARRSVRQRMKRGVME